MLWNIIYKYNGNEFCHFNKNTSVRRIKQNNRLMLVSNCSICGKAKSSKLIIKKQVDY